MRHFDDESEVQDAQKRASNLSNRVWMRPAALESSEQPLDLVPQLVEFTVAVPFDFAVHTVRAAAPHESKRKEWMEPIKNQLKAGRVDDVIADLKPYRRLEAVATLIRTYRTNEDRMGCDLCRKRGLPVGSSVVENVCKEIVGSRFKGAGRRCSKAGSQRLARRQMLLQEQPLARLLDWWACSAAAA